MVYMDADQAADFFGAGPVPAHVVIETREALDARIAALIA